MGKAEGDEIRGGYDHAHIQYALLHPLPGGTHIPGIQVRLCSRDDFIVLAVFVEACGPRAASDCTCQIVYMSIFEVPVHTVLVVLAAITKHLMKNRNVTVSYEG